MKKKSDALDADLAPIHGSVAFMEFINKKACRKPEVSYWNTVHKIVEWILLDLAFNLLELTLLFGSFQCSAIKFQT